MGGRDAGPGDRTVWAIVLAAGTGRRFGGRKQLARVGGQRLVDRIVATVDAVCDGVVVVLPPDRVWDGPPVAAWCPGGRERADSVRAGLALVPAAAHVVVVADAAHPLASTGLVASLVAGVRDGADAVVPVVPLREIVQRLDGDRVVATLPTTGGVLTQMPQAFRADVLRAAHAGATPAVDDSTLVLATGATVVAVAGEPSNLHVTTPAELAVLDALAAGVGAVSGP